MQVGWVKIGDFRQIAGYISKTVIAEPLVTAFEGLHLFDPKCNDTCHLAITDNRCEYFSVF